MDTEFSLIICTRNRVEMLHDTVESILCRLSSFPNSHLVIIDNGSDDGTPNYLQKLALADKRVIVDREPKPGLYHARLRGIERAQGQFLLFLDDDMFPGANWPAGLLQELIENPKVGVVGTVVDPVWESPRPSWMTDRLARTTFGPSFSRRQRYRFPRYAPGGSCAIRVCDFLRLYRSPERKYIELGWGAQKSPGGVVGGEDWDLSELYIRNGFEVIGLPHVHTGHRAHASRLNPASVLRKFETDGRCRVRFARLAGYSPFSLRAVVLMLAYPALIPVDWLIEHAQILGPRTLTLQTYIRTARGLWAETIWGIRGITFPFTLSP